MSAHVLLVDDDDDLRELLTLSLELAGFTVHAVPNGREAIAAIPDVPSPRVMVLDLLMPVMNGWETVAALEARGLAGTIPIVISTSAPNEAPRGYPVVAKPTPLDRLIDAIRAHAG